MGWYMTVIPILGSRYRFCIFEANLVYKEIVSKRKKLKDSKPVFMVYAG